MPGVSLHCPADAVATKAIVAYSVQDNEQTDLTNGIVLQLPDKTATTHGGKVSWNEADNSLTYISGHSRPIEKFYIDENRKIVTEKPATPALAINVSSYVIRDIRNGILHTYPIVKIGAQYWMKEDLQTAHYNDSKSMPLRKALGDGEGYLKWAGTNSHFYNGEAVLTGKLAPLDWRLPTENDWNNYLYHVMANIGGIYIENTTVGDGVKTYTYVEKEKQEASLDFLLNEVLCYPRWLFDTEISDYTFLLRKNPTGVIEYAPSQILKNTQGYIFWDLLSNDRLMRMLENELKNGKKAFTVVEMMDKMHNSIFATTIKGGTPDVMERNLQKGFLDALITAAAESEGVKINKQLTATSGNPYPVPSHTVVQSR